MTSLGLASLPLLNCDLGNGKRPNILLILTDDQGWGDITSHGNEILSTPNMDRIAAEGVRFDRFYVSPVCAPTRASLLTGRYHLRTGVHGVTRGEENMRAEEVTLAEILKSKGYSTGCFGKWHNGAHGPMHPNGQGFDEFVGFCAGHWNNYFDTQMEHNGQTIETEGYMADVLTDKALTFMEDQKENPWLCYIPYNPPHSPFQVPDQFFDKYKQMGLDDTLACVYGMCENLDDNIGRLLDKLDDLEIADNTIVLFITDNGPNSDRFNGNMRGRKASVHEGGIRVPCFIRWPGRIEPGRTVLPIADHIDILPTVLSLCDISLPGELELDGKDLTPLIRNPEADWTDRALFSYWAGRGAMRTEQYRLIVNPESVELYDMIKDPGETKDNKGENPETAAQMKSAYDVWFEDVTKNGFNPIPIPIGYKGEAEVIMPAHEAYLSSDGIEYFEGHGWANDWIAEWTDKAAYPYWEIEVLEGGQYEIALDYICPKKEIGATFQIEVGEQKLSGRISKPHNPPPVHSPDRVPRKEVYEKTWATLSVGLLQLNPGKYQLKVKALSRPGNIVMDLKAVRIRML
ncbi:arylsulfatase [candidate division KSB1 bacterium]|nr:arylsulfatase [candidate division KSB1 bacterium]